MPVSGSQIRTVSSPPPVASQLPSGAIATASHAVGVAGEGVALGAGDRVPDPHRAVVAGGGQPAAVRGDRHRPHAAGVAGEGVALGAGGRVPDPHRAVVSRRWPASCRPGRPPPPAPLPVWPVRVWRGVPVTGSQIRTVPSSLAVASQLPSGAIATAHTPPVWPVRVWRWVPVTRIPDPHRAVVAGGGQPAAVRGDRHRLHPAGVAGEGVALGAGDRVPDPHRAVVAGGGQPAAVRGDRHRPHPAGVAGEGVALGAGGRVPDPHRAVVAGGGQPAAVRGDRHRLHAAGVAGEGVAWVPVTGSQIRTVPSSLAVASQVPSGATATAPTLPVWPVRVWRWVPVSGSQIRTVPSPLAVASQLPSGAIATAATLPVWPVRVWRGCR